MSNTLFTAIGWMFLSIFGAPWLVGVAIIGFILFLLLAARVGKVAVIAILIPLLVTIAITGATSWINIGSSSSWIPIIFFVFLGIAFSAVIIKLVGA